MVPAAIVNERLKLTRFEHLDLTHPLWCKAASRAASYSESVRGLCLRDVYFFVAVYSARTGKTCCRSQRLRNSG